MPTAFPSFCRNRCDERPDCFASSRRPLRFATRPIVALLLFSLLAGPAAATTSPSLPRFATDSRQTDFTDRPHTALPCLASDEQPSLPLFRDDTNRELPHRVLDLVTTSTNAFSVPAAPIFARVISSLHSRAFCGARSPAQVPLRL